MAQADEKLFLWINGWVGWFEPFDEAVEWIVSDYLVPVGLVMAMLGLWFIGATKAERHRHQLGVFVGMSATALASLTVLIINVLYSRPRPFVDLDVSMLFYQPTDPSFPSNGTAAAFALAAAGWGVNRRVGYFMLAAAGLYGFARVYAGVHYPLDVIAGALIGMVVAFLVFKLKDLLEPIPTIVLKAFRIFCLA